MAPRRSYRRDHWWDPIWEDFFGGTIQPASETVVGGAKNSEVYYTDKEMPLAGVYTGPPYEPVKGVPSHYGEGPQSDRHNQIYHNKPAPKRDPKVYTKPNPNNDISEEDIRVYGKPQDYDNLRNEDIPDPVHYHSTTKPDKPTNPVPSRPHLPYKPKHENPKQPPIVINPGKPKPPDSYFPPKNMPKYSKGGARIIPVSGAYSRREIVGSRVKISECTEKYNYAQRNPFKAAEDNIAEVCMPDMVVLPTRKQKLITKGSGSTGTTGLGCIYANPHAICNDQYVARVTASNSVMVGSTLLSAVTNLGIVQFSGSNFVQASMAPGALEYRTAGFGVRIRYTGTNDNMGGTVYCYRSPSNSEVNGLTFDEISGYPETTRYVLDRQWKTVVWKVCRPDDTDFATSTADDYPVVIMVQSATGAAVPFDYEVVNFHELIGSTIQNTTASHSDPIGNGVAQANSSKADDSHSGEGQTRSALHKELQKGLESGTSYVDSDYAKLGALILDLIPGTCGAVSAGRKLLSGAMHHAGASLDIAGRATELVDHIIHEGDDPSTTWDRIVQVVQKNLEERNAVVRRREANNPRAGYTVEEPDDEPYFVPY